MTGLLIPGVHQRDRGIVVDRLGVHALDEAQLVGDALQVRHEVADPEPALAARPAARDRRHHEKLRLTAGHARHPLRALHARRNLLTREVVHRRLLIEEVDVRETAGLKQTQHPLSLRREVRHARKSAGRDSRGKTLRIEHRLRGTTRRGAAQRFEQQRPEGESADATGTGADETPAGQVPESVFEDGVVIGHVRRPVSGG